MFDLQVAELKNKLIEDINNSNMPLTVIKYILSDINREVSSELEKAIERQRAKREEEQSLLDVEQKELIDGEF